MKKEGVKESWWQLFTAAYKKCKEAVNFYLLGLVTVLTFFSSALEAISLGLVIPLLEQVLNNKDTELGIVQKILDFLSILLLKDPSLEKLWEIRGVKS